MKKQTGPDSIHLKSEEDLQTFINHYDASVVGLSHVTCYLFLLLHDVT